METLPPTAASRRPSSSATPRLSLQTVKGCTSLGRRCLKAWGGPRPPSAWRRGFSRALCVWLLVGCLVFPTFLFVFGAVSSNHSFASALTRWTPSSWRRRQQISDDCIFRRQSPEMPSDRHAGGLLAAGFDEQSCLSRYQSSMFRKPSPHRPSPYLLQRLRMYEEHHRRCAPHTGPFNRTLKYLHADHPPEAEAECSYVLWSPCYGLGNRMLTLASTFLYALLTDRVLLIDRGEDMAGLFCEPFPGTTWLLPDDFPTSFYDQFDRDHPMSYGNLRKNNNISTDGGGPAPPPYVYLYLIHDYEGEDMHFFCEPDQAVLLKVPWLFLRSNNYIVPAFFLNRDFQPELSRLFPKMDTVFHHLGRYLFHPTNQIWGMITRYYQSYLAMAKERVAIQIRIFNSEEAPFDVVLEQVVNCTLRQGILPKVVDDAAGGGNKSGVGDPSTNVKAVMITSLDSGYFDKIKDMYWEHPAAGGMLVAVHQPSHEEWQQTDTSGHDGKAWAEMYLLSLADVLVTTAWSTFGYVGQGLAGVRPLVLARSWNSTVPQPTCQRDFSMEPCFHSPPWFVCREKKDGDNGDVVPFVTHCMDVESGIKLVDRT